MGRLRTYAAGLGWYRRLSDAKFALLTLLSPAWNTMAMWKRAYHRPLERRDPKLLSDKQAWLKLNVYNRSPLVHRLADKLLVREYARERGLGENLIEVLGVWDTPGEIDVTGIDAPFVLKASLGCGGHVFCRDKAALDMDAARAQLKAACSPMNWLRYAELQYRPGKGVPQRFFAERMLDVPEGGAPDDFKFHCYGGKPVHITYCYDRGPDGHPKMIRLNMDWEADPRLAEWNRGAGEVPPKPGCFGEMVRIAETLAAPFPFVRVDLYVERGRPLLGEMTFTPAGCLQADYPRDTELWLGGLVDLTKIDAGALEIR